MSPTAPLSTPTRSLREGELPPQLGLRTTSRKPPRTLGACCTDRHQTLNPKPSKGFHLPDMQPLKQLHILISRGSAGCRQRHVDFGRYATVLSFVSVSMSSCMRTCMHASCVCVCMHACVGCAWSVVRVYTDTRRVSAEAKASLASEGASLREYHQLSGDLRRILCGSKGRQLLRSAEGLLGAVDACLGASGEARLQEANAKLQRHEHSSQRQPFVWLDPKVSISVHRLVADERPVLLKDTPVTVAKVRSCV